jgi:acyl-CoA thioesterase
MVPIDNSKNAFMLHCHVVPIDLDKLDYSKFRMDGRPDLLNPHGMIHGGALYTLADNAAGYAAHTDGRRYVTQTSSFHFLRNQGGGVVHAEGRVIHRGRTTCLTAVEITSEDGTLLATGEFTFFCITPDGK